jgi:hypothetical protein
MRQARRESVEPFPGSRRDPSIGQLLADLVADTSLLIRQEIALAKTELTEMLSALGTGLGLVAAGGLIAFAGSLFLLAAAVIGLATVVQPWLSALLVGGTVVIVGGVVVLCGKSRLTAEKLTPRRTIRALEDDAEWLKERMQ